MNERIKLLAEQAYELCGKHSNDYNGPAFTEKFAELILQDVLSICEDLGDKGLDGHYCVDKIRKEFAV